MRTGPISARRCGQITNLGEAYPLPCVKPEGHDGPCNPTPESGHDRFIGVPTTRYATIVADPPWEYPRADKRLPTRASADEPYPTMSLGDICALPVSDLADQAAHLYLWTTAEHLRYAFAVVGAWGFTYRTTIVWCKRGLGMGAAVWRNSTEFVLFGTRGYLKPSRRDLGTWHEWTTGRRHSQKPDAFYDVVQTASPGPYLELFARGQRLGWDTWGDEALQHVAMEAAS